MERSQSNTQLAAAGVTPRSRVAARGVDRNGPEKAQEGPAGVSGKRRRELERRTTVDSEAWELFQISAPPATQWEFVPGRSGILLTPFLLLSSTLPYRSGISLAAARAEPSSISP